MPNLKRYYGSRVLGKVRKTQHQNPEFGHTQGEIFLKPAKQYISIFVVNLWKFLKEHFCQKLVEIFKT
jgi:hypothetical protein